MADINIAGGFQPTTTNTPLDSRTVIATESDIHNIKLPYVGMFVYAKETDTVYVVTGLKSSSVGPNDIPDMVVDTYEPVWQAPEDIVLIQPDWNQSSPDAIDYIKNKPSLQDIPGYDILVAELKAYIDDKLAGA